MILEPKKESKQAEGNKIESSRPVLMLESCVVQLLCVQMVGKDVPRQDTLKYV